MEQPLDNDLAKIRIWRWSSNTLVPAARRQDPAVWRRTGFVLAASRSTPSWRRWTDRAPPPTQQQEDNSQSRCVGHWTTAGCSINRSPVLGSVTWSPHLQEFPSSQRQLLQEVLSRNPAGDPIGLLNILRLGPLQDRSDVFLGILDLLHLDLRSGRGRTNQKISSSTSPPCGKHRDNKSGYYYNLWNATSVQNSCDWGFSGCYDDRRLKPNTHHSFENDVWFAVVRGVNDAGAVDEEDASHQSDVLPHLQTTGSEFNSWMWDTTHRLDQKWHGPNQT